MDKYLLRSSSNESLTNKRPAEEVIWRTPKRTITNPKKSVQPPVSTSNRYAGLSDVPNSQGESIQTTSNKVKKPRVPEIVVTMKDDCTHKALTSTVSRFTKKFNLKYRPAGKVAIHCYSNKSHKLLVDGLRSENMFFHTHDRKEDRKYKVVIRGVPADQCESVRDELSDLGFDAASVTKMKTTNPTNKYTCVPLLVQLPAGTDIVKFKEIKYLCNCVVQIERFRPNNNFGTQCYRCQRFGHASKNCNLPERCVKCVGAHGTKDCAKKDRNSPAQCCNCNENHPANYRQCSARTAYLQRQEDNALKSVLPKLKNSQQPKMRTVNHTEPVDQRPAVQAKAHHKSAYSWASTLSSSKPEQVDYKLKDTQNMDAATSEMLQILKVIKTIKDQFTVCPTMVDKVILILSHLGQYV